MYIKYIIDCSFDPFSFRLRGNHFETCQYILFYFETNIIPGQKNYFLKSIKKMKESVYSNMKTNHCDNINMLGYYRFGDYDYPSMISNIIFMDDPYETKYSIYLFGYDRAEICLGKNINQHFTPDLNEKGVKKLEGEVSILNNIKDEYGVLRKDVDPNLAIYSYKMKDVSTLQTIVISENENKKKVQKRRRKSRKIQTVMEVVSREVQTNELLNESKGVQTDPIDRQIQTNLLFNSNQANIENGNTRLITGRLDIQLAPRESSILQPESIVLLLSSNNQ